jgi:zinc/manganese transport system substrate-binding protein
MRRERKPGRPRRPGSPALAVALTTLTALTALTACSGADNAVRPAGAVSGVIRAVGAENQYASVIGQVGGRYVAVTAVESNPGTDPHAYEASPGVAKAISTARLIVQNGLGYDTFMNKIESASPGAGRTVIVAARLLGLPDSTPNPHLWYDPATMPAVARAVARALAAMQPAHKAYFDARMRRFVASLRPWYRALAQLRADFPGAAVAVTEPVADYMLRAAGLRILTPFSLQADIMNGVDLAPQLVALQDSLLSEGKVRALVYNQQVTDPVTASFLTTARQNEIPVVGAYETMPAPGFDYQTWMMAEVRALHQALARRVSTERL